METKGYFVDGVHVVGALSPSADLYNGNPATDVVDLSGFEKAVFLLVQKTGGSNTGTATIKAEAVDNPSASNAVNIPFKYAKKTTGANDTMGTVTAAVAGTGFTTTANEDTTYVIEVDATDIPDGQSYVRLTLTEAVNDPVLGAVVCLLVSPRYGKPFPSALD